MKKSKVFILFLIFGLQSKAQINLIQNPSFEDTVECPLGGDQLYKAIKWSSFRGTPDYFHDCCISVNCSVGVPENDLGFQYPHSGHAYAGMIPYDLTGAPYREYIANDLLTPLTVGQRYFVTFYLSWSGKIGFTIAINKIGISLSTIQFSNSTPYPITNNPMVYSDSIYRDSANWSKIQLSFIADSAYKFMIIGNFFDDSHTDTLNLGQFNVHCYEYIDDVCISTDSAYCSNYTAINETDKLESGNLIENYFFEYHNLIIKFKDIYDQKSIYVFNDLGQNISLNRTKEMFEKIDFSNLHKGIYYVKIYCGNKSQSLKLAY